MRPVPRSLLTILLFFLGIGAPASLEPAAALTDETEEAGGTAETVASEGEPESEEVEGIAEFESPRVLDAFAYDDDAEVEPREGESEVDLAARNAAKAVTAGRDGKGRHKTIQLSGLVAVQVSQPEALLGEGQEGCTSLRLTFDGLAFEDTLPIRCTHDLVVFNLDLIERAEEPAWRSLVQRRHGVYGYTNISLQEGPNGEPLPSDATDRRIHLYNTWLGLLALALLLVVLWGFFRMARRSNMLRDSGSKRAANEPLRPYSLARSQTAWWFFLVLVSFIFISLIKGSLVVIPATILGLMGIAGGTFLGSELVDTSRRSDSDPPLVASRDRLGYFLDIFSDAGGVAFHRFQMFVWTLALGIIFVVKVARNLEIPEFDPSVLGLMGISSGTYLGMKIPESPKSQGIDNTPQPPDGGDPESTGE